MKKFNGKLFASALIVLTLFSVLAISVAAQTAPATSTASPSSDKQAQERIYHDLYLDKLASNLGTTRDKLVAAQQGALKDTLAQQVKDGKLTQAQADKVAANAALRGDGDFSALRQAQAASRHQAAKQFGIILKDGYKAVADKLGLTTEQLSSELKDGKSIADLAKAKGVSESDLKAAAVAAVKTDLDKAVVEGKVTAAQEQKLLDRVNKADLARLFKHSHRAKK